MGSQIVIDPVHRIEGHGKITIQLDASGHVEDAAFHVTQFRGFEKFCEGRPYYEMPSLVERICGICPISHALASAKACDAILGVTVPAAGQKLRTLLNLASIMQSHALSFFHLSSPDLLLGFDGPPEKRNILGLLETHPQLATDGIRLRQIGQSIIEWLAGKKIHPTWVVPGGVGEPLSTENLENIRAVLPEARDIVLRTIGWFKPSMEDYREEIRTFANFPSMFLGLVDPRGNLAHFDGNLRFMDYQGNIVADQVPPARYADYIGEAVENDSYLKSPYYLPIGYPEGIYRVGPAARLNVCGGCRTLLADEEWAEFKSLEKGPVLSAFYNHYARLIEILYTIEKAEQLTADPDILSPKVRSHAQPNFFEGIGVVEAPRGTLFHHYQVDENGLITGVNLIVATGNNNLAMNHGVLQVARHFIKNGEVSEPVLTRLEAVIRAFDPCLSCATHALGMMTLHVRLLGPDGRVMDEKWR
ncbi:Ni/Fe hydrogenase subunit alpha [Desulfosarcina cetonica]|uniref:Ni/Fe hydrogenase subunit alpha n=1 Tax=Desulfosarcina cetonica TaxID=90730 RepID=UPI0006D1B00D|nr:Ni/Fe hydrogenase subunit alpha [Desulfosarcina cetonica]